MADIVYVLENDQAGEHAFNFELSGSGGGSDESDGGDTLEILPLHSQQSDGGQEVTYIQVAAGSSGVSDYPPDRMVDLQLEYGPGWRTDMLQDLHTSCSDMFSYPVFCRDGVFWSSKLLLGAVSKMLSVAITTSDPESCLVIPDLSRHDLQMFYNNAFRGYTENDNKNIRSIKNVADTFAIGPIMESNMEVEVENEEDEEEEDDEDNTPVLFGYLKKSDKIKLSHYFGHSQNDGCEDSSNNIELQLRPFRQNCFPCSICNRKFSESSQLEKHRNMVHSKKVLSSELNNPYKCSICDRRFAFFCNVRRHIWLHHNKETKSQITKISSTSDEKSNRYYSRQEKLQDIKCKICGKYFPNWKSLQLHVLDHTSDRPYMCQECGKGFKEESKLKRHSLIHSGIKPFSCNYCRKSFSLKQNRDIHERLHTGTGFPCEYCNETLSQKVNLRKHESKHEKLNHIKSSNPHVKEKQSCISSRRKIDTNGNKRSTKALTPKLLILGEGSNQRDVIQLKSTSQYVDIS